VCSEIGYYTKYTAANYFLYIEKMYKKYIVENRLDPRIAEHVQRVERITFQYDRYQVAQRNELFANAKLQSTASGAIANNL